MLRCVIIRKDVGNFLQAVNSNDVAICSSLAAIFR